MSKKERLQLLLDKLNALQNEEETQGYDVENLTDDLIKEEVASLTSKLKESSNIKVLKRFNTELTKLRHNFDTKPIIEAVKQLQSDIEESEKKLLDEFETKIKDIPKVPDLTSNLSRLRDELEGQIKDIKIPDIVSPLGSLRSEFEAKLEALENSGVKEDIENIQKQMQDLVKNDIESDKELRTQIEKNFETTIEKLRKDFLQRISNRGGGNAAPQVNVNSSVMSKRYLDQNFLAGSGITLTTADDDTLKRTNITVTGTGAGANTALSNLAAVAVNQTLQFGSPSATPTAFSVIGNAGLGTNIAGATLTLAGGAATGNAVGGSLIFQTSAVGASGTTLQSLTTALTIDNTQKSTFAGVVALAAGTAGAPSIYFSSDTTTGWYRSSANVRTWTVSGTPNSIESNGRFYLGSNGIIGFTETADPTLAGSIYAMYKVAGGLAGPGVLGFQDLNLAGTWIQHKAGDSRVSTQFDKTSDTALAAITGLTSTLIAGRSYSFKIVLHVTAGAVGGENVDLGGGTATATAVISEVRVLANTTNVYAETSRQTSLTGTSGGVAGDTVYFIELDGLITVNAAGTFKPRFAQKVSNGTASSVLVGSYMTMMDIA